MLQATAVLGSDARYDTFGGPLLEVTYAELGAIAGKVARGLIGLGVKTGDRVAILERELGGLATVGRPARVAGRSEMHAVGHERPRIVIAGGGVAAVEALLALGSLCPHVTRTTLISPARELLERPVTVGEAFGRSTAQAYDLADVVGNVPGARIICDSVAEVQADQHVVLTASGTRVGYDKLVIAVGAIPRQALSGALTFGGRSDVSALRQLLDELSRKPGRSVALVLPSERIWPLPIYELALMTAAHLGGVGPGRPRVTVVTPEAEPLELFGATAVEAISRRLAAQRIAVRTSSLVTAIEGRTLRLAGAGELHADRVIALPILEGPRLPGLPHDEDGFIPVDAAGRVSGVADVFAAGDATAFALKQGGLAAQQADAVAQQIAADVGVAIRPEPFRPVLRGLLMTGGAPLYLRAEPQRLPRQSTVAVDAPRHRSAPPDASVTSGEPLWWPPTKIAGRYLASYLATGRAGQLDGEPLTDRAPASPSPASDPELRDALELALLLADCDAKWGDYRSALTALDAARAISGSLPPDYEARRRQWLAASRLD